MTFLVHVLLQRWAIVHNALNTQELMQWLVKMLNIWSKQHLHTSKLYSASDITVVLYDAERTRLMSNLKHADYPSPASSFTVDSGATCHISLDKFLSVQDFSVTDQEIEMCTNGKAELWFFSDVKLTTTLAGQVCTRLL